MDISVGRPQGFDIPKKSRSLDLRSFYVKKLKGSQNRSWSEKDVYEVEDESKASGKQENTPFKRSSSHVAESGRKRFGKEVPLSSLGSSPKRHNSHPNALKLKKSGHVSHSSSSLNGDSPHLSDDDDDELPLSAKLNNVSLQVKCSEHKTGFCKDVIILKRPRGITKKRKAEGAVNLEAVETNLSHESCRQVANNQSSLDILSESRVPNTKREVCESNLTGGGNSHTHVFAEDVIHVQISDAKSGTRKNFSDAEKSSFVNDLPVAYDSKASSGKGPVDDEDNLEENAARMLSSRFDPSCTTSSKDRNVSKKKASKLSPHYQSSFRKSPRSGSSSVDAAGRMLRPRRQNGKSVARKRRHFYEVCSRNIDPYYIVKQRIRVFWPLDKCWYFGLVKDYDPMTKLHHVKYEDREEEWINLQKERIKLLLFPSEVSRRFNSEKSGLELKRRKKKSELDAKKTSCRGNLLDSEPIISWLSRATQRAKYSSGNIIKRQSTVSRIKSIEPSRLLESLDGVSGSLGNGITSKTLSNGEVPDQSTVGDIIRAPELNRTIESENMKLPYVYSRRRFRKKVASNIKLEQDSCHNNPAALVISSLNHSGGTTSIGQVNVLTISEPKQITVKLQLPLLYIRKLTFRMRNILLYYSLSLMQHGKLICAWPVVHLEIVFVDKTDVIRFLLFDGGLRKALSLFCLIARTSFHRDVTSNSPRRRVAPTSIGFDISDLYYSGRKIFIILTSFVLEKEWWRKLEHKLKKLFKEGEVVIADSTCSSTKSSQLSCISKLCSSTIRNLSSVKVNVDKIRHLAADEQNSDIKLGKSIFSMDESASGLANPNTGCLVSTGASKLETPSNSWLSGDLHVIQPNLGCGDMVRSTNDPNMTSRKLCKNSSLQCADKPSCSSPEHASLSEVSFHGGASCLSATNKPEQLVEQMEQNSYDNGVITARTATDLVSGMYEHIVHSPTARRSMWHRSRHTSLSRTFSHRSKLWPEEFMRNGLMSGNKKSQTRVSSAVFTEGYELGDKLRKSHQKNQPHKKVKTESKKVADDSGNTDGNLGSLTCEANILITVGDKGWREYGAQVVLDSDDRRNWNISTKVSGTIKYVHKAQHILQPGTTNRYNHAMMWKGGKEWVLEFTERSQWSLFKQLHEECYNRNIRAACVKNIPIPGVRLLVDGDCRSAELAFTRSSSKYVRQVGTEIDFALDPSRVLYDMDSDDEEWLTRQRDSSNAQSSEMLNITDETFEKLMHMLEKLAYARQCHEFSDEEIAEFMDNVGSADIVRPIHDYWRLKRQKKGLPLIRQFQSPLWERYQQQLKEWESVMSKIPNHTVGSQNETCTVKKPPMFAFCLKPRGLEVLNKGSKQRSHKKLMVTGKHSAFPREQDCFFTTGRKLDGVMGGDDKALATISSYESSDSFQGQQSFSAISSRDTASTDSISASEGSDNYPDPKLYRRSHSKKIGSFHSSRELQVTTFSSSQRSKMNGLKRWNSEHFEWSGMKQPHSAGFQRNPLDIDEFRLRDASNAAQHASNMAKLKREKANWLLHKADLALHRATVGLMIAEAMKASEKVNIADG